MSLESARLEFNGVASTAITIKKRAKDIHGGYKEACSSCSPLLKHFNIIEVKI